MTTSKNLNLFCLFGFGAWDGGVDSNNFYHPVAHKSTSKPDLKHCLTFFPAEEPPVSRPSIDLLILDSLTNAQ